MFSLIPQNNIIPIYRLFSKDEFFISLYEELISSGARHLKIPSDRRNEISAQ